MTGWGYFWTVYRRGSVTQTQTSSRRMNQSVNRTSRQDVGMTASRSMATTTTSSPAAEAKNIIKTKNEEDRGCANEFDDVSLRILIYWR
jgi:hypothetical protein